MPTPKPYEKKKDFIRRCVLITIRDKSAKTNEQAVAICNSLWDKRND